ncbi:TIR domain-containing protein [Methanoculleus sp.]|uniref:TIR domain-containing protein n=1 Tax=Methanoculleus sp. TaxID=90427 RepID=UPI002FC83678
MADYFKSNRSEEITLGASVFEKNTRLNLFISYSHKDNTPDNPNIEEFVTHIAPLKDNGSIEVWYDHSIIGGEKFREKIDYKLEDADIICLFVSANFLASDECKREKKKAFEFRNKMGVAVVPIILSHCGWQTDPDIVESLALPTDGKPVSRFCDKTEAWQDVYEGLIKLIEKEQRIRQLKINNEFEEFLYDAELLAKAHPKKTNVCLDDIYICTELIKYDNLKRNHSTVDSDELLDSLFDDGKIIIAGENQSGKTTLCKRIFVELRRRNFIPVYVSDKRNSFLGKMENIISKSLHEQYCINEKDVDIEKIIPIIDDFHRAKDKEKHVKSLVKYSHCVIVVDDIFSLNIKDGTLISSFTTFRMKELKPSLINSLIKKWVNITDKEAIDYYKDIDKNTDFIYNTLGRNMGKGLMPAYPFFVLSTLVTYETFEISLNQDITTQGYCYQAFIVYYLRRHGVRSDEIDTYMNFLTELASYMHKEKQEELSYDNFSSFMQFYSIKYNLPVEEDILLTNLNEIVARDSFNNYSFRYSCFYYYFVAKYLSEHIGEPDGMVTIKGVLDNLHVDENAYIAVFLTHHSKSNIILEEIERIASSLFDKYGPATLTKGEMKFFDEQAHIIVKAVLPAANVTPEMNRAERLKFQDDLEQSLEDKENEGYIDENDSSEKDLRKAIKTVEVMGCITRNRAGSLEKDKLRKIFSDGMNVHLRILSSFFEMIQSEDQQKDIVEVISKKLSNFETEKGPYNGLNEEKRREYAKNIFWNLSFLFTYGIISKIVRSLGSDKFTAITNEVCDNVDNPASFLIKQGIFMGYVKNVRPEIVAKRINKNDFSEIAKRVILFMVVEHCSLNPVSYQDLQRIKVLLKVSVPPRLQLN